MKSFIFLNNRCYLLINSRKWIILYTSYFFQFKNEGCNTNIFWFILRFLCSFFRSGFISSNIEGSKCNYCTFCLRNSLLNIMRIHWSPALRLNNHFLVVHGVVRMFVYLFLTCCFLFRLLSWKIVPWNKLKNVSNKSQIGSSIFF